MPLLSGLSTGVKQGTRLSARAISMVRWAAKIEPLSESHCTGYGARMVPKRCSTERTIMSRIISPEMPAVVATQEITSTFENVSDIGVCLGLFLGPPG